MNEYVNGDLKANYASNGDFLAGAMQVAIWKLEDEYYYTDYEKTYGALADTLFELANTYGANSALDNVKLVHHAMGFSTCEDGIKLTLTNKIMIVPFSTTITLPPEPNKLYHLLYFTIT